MENLLYVIPFECALCHNVDVVKVFDDIVLPFEEVIRYIPSKLRCGNCTITNMLIDIEEKHRKINTHMDGATRPKRQYTKRNK